MSLIGSLLAFVVIPLKAKPLKERPPKPDRSAEVEAATFALNHWRSAWHVLWAENERLRQEKRMLETERDRYRDHADHWREAYAALGRAGIARRVEAQAQYEGLCNCVPSRSQVLGPESVIGNSHGLSA